MKHFVSSLFGCIALLIGGCAMAGSPNPSAYDHIVIVIEENHSAAEVLTSPYLSDLAHRGVFFSQSFAITHPSQPNYIALFSGSTQSVTDNALYDLTAPNLATALAAAGLSFTGYSEDLPAIGFRGEFFGQYVRKHNPWASFTNVSDSANRPFSDFPTSEFDDLPTVSIVVPNLDNDMHDGTVAAGDAWLAANLDLYSRWAPAHNSLLIITFDEGSLSLPADTTPIATIFVGARVKAGFVSDQRIDHYSILRMLEEMYGLVFLGETASADAVAWVWQ